MTYNVEDLLSKIEPELTTLFSNAEAGPIPNGDAQGTAIIAPGTTFTPEIAKFINFFAWQGKIFDAEKIYATQELNRCLDA